MWTLPPYFQSLSKDREREREKGVVASAQHPHLYYLTKALCDSDHTDKGAKEAGPWLPLLCLQ